MTRSSLFEAKDAQTDASSCWRPLAHPARRFARAVGRLARWARRVAARCVPSLPRAPLDDRELGALGEDAAARALARSGYAIRGRRVATPAGEIDILAREGEQWVVVEVKTARALVVPRRKGAPARELALRWRPGARLARRQLARLAEAARALGSDSAPRFQRSRGARAARVDLVEVYFEEARGACRICHHKDVLAPIGRSDRAPMTRWIQ